MNNSTVLLDISVIKSACVTNCNKSNHPTYSIIISDAYHPIRHNNLVKFNSFIWVVTNSNHKLPVVLPLAGYPGGTLSQILPPFPKITPVRSERSLAKCTKWKTPTQGFTKTHVTDGIDHYKLYGLSTWWAADKGEEALPTFLWSDRIKQINNTENLCKTTN
jgi:hypothetical protein